MIENAPIIKENKCKSENIHFHTLPQLSYAPYCTLFQKSILSITIVKRKRKTERYTREQDMQEESTTHYEI